MSEHSNLLTALDAVYGGSDVTDSRYKVERQGFDNDKQEHFVTLQYFYRRDTSPQSKELRRGKKEQQQPARAKMPTHRARKAKNMALLQAVNARAKQQSQLKMGGFPLT